MTYQEFTPDDPEHPDDPETPVPPESDLDYDELPLSSTKRDRVMFTVAQWLFHRREKSIKDVVQLIHNDTGTLLKRTQLYAIGGDAVDRGYAVFCPPIDRQLSFALQTKTKADVQVVPTFGTMAPMGVADRGAELVLDLILRIASARGEVHVAFGVGSTTRWMVKHLLARLATMRDRPRIVVHGLSPALHPECMPDAEDLPAPANLCLDRDRDYVPLLTAPFVNAANYRHFLAEKHMREAIDRSREIDVVVSSLANSEDRHGFLRSYLKQRDVATLSSLERRHWLGDLHLNAYAALGPIELEAGTRPVTLFQFADFVQMAQTPGKHVILLCAPCGKCQRYKTDALRPLVTNTAMRAWNHLIVDYRTADALCA